MKITYGRAIQQAIYDEMEMDSTVFILGEDIQKNLYGYTGDLVEKFGIERVLNIPLSEASVMGIACGAAMCGLRPIVDLTITNFLYVAMDQIANMAAKLHYMSNGLYSLPLTILCSDLSGNGNAAQHSDRVHSLFQNIPGLKIICPATPQDMYSMMRGSIRDCSPVLCISDRSLFWTEENVEYQIQKLMYTSNIVKEGNDVSVITISSCLKMIKEILPILEKLNISVEIIDVRSIVPLDFQTILESVNKTGRVIICDTANKTGSVASEIAARISQDAFYFLKEPVQIVACEDVPIPFAKELEKEVLVTKEKILDRITNAFHYD